MTDPVVLRLARDIDRAYRRRYLEYQLSCAEYRSAGLTPQHCEHGVNQWVDYDAICYQCEQGITFGNPKVRRRLALDAAKERVEKATALVNLIHEATRLGVRSAIDEREIWRRISDLLRAES